jgi:tetratricopeptide (TPR) repeat protein
MPEKNFYEILQIDPKADVNTIKRAYRSLMRQYHPDSFTADIARLQKAGDNKSLAALERKMEQAKVQAQQVNQAYAVLGDAIKRKAYDQKLSDDRMATYYAEIRRERSINPEEGRRTVKSRPHHQRPGAPSPKLGVFPWIIFAVLLVIAIAFFSFLTRAMTQNLNAVYVPRASTAVGVITSQDLQATQNAINATNIARTRTALAPTITPLSAEQYERSADRLLERGLVNQAISSYSRAIQFAPGDADLYFKRGYAHTLLFFEDGVVAIGNTALADFGMALGLNPELSAAYRERGMVYFGLWQQSNDAVVAQAALDDLEAYSSMVDPVDDMVHQAISTLRENITEP